MTYQIVIEPVTNDLEFELWTGASAIPEIHIPDFELLVKGMVWEPGSNLDVALEVFFSEISAVRVAEIVW